MDLQAERNIVRSRTIQHGAVGDLGWIEMNVTGMAAIIDVQQCFFGRPHDGILAIPAQQNAIALAFHAEAKTGIGKDDAQKPRSFATAQAPEVKC